MTYTFVISDSPYFFAMALASVIAFAMALYVWPRRSSPGGKYFTLLMVAAGEWLLAAGLEMVAADVPTKILCAKLSYFGVVFLSPLFLLFALDYYRMARWLKPKYVLLLMVIPLVTLGLAVTNEWHGLIWSNVSMAPGAGEKMAVYDHGLWFWAYAAYCYVLCALAAVVLACRSLRDRGPQRSRDVIILSAAALIVITSLVITNNIQPGLDVVSFVIIVAVVFYGWYLYGNSVFDIVTVAQRSLVASTADGVLVLDSRDRILSINAAAGRLIGAPGSRAGDSAGEIMAQQPSLLAVCRAVDDRPQEIRLTPDDGSPLWLEARVTTLSDARERPTGRLIVLHDVTERKRGEEQMIESLHEKEVLLKEIHHRVKNNLQIISSLLSLQSGTVDPEHVQMFRESQNRIRSMALIHEKLYRSGDLSHIDFADYVNSLVAPLARSYLPADSQVKVDVDIRDVHLNIDQAIPCGLIINELVSNSLKYAFPEGRSGTIAVRMSREASGYVLAVGDDGVGLRQGVDFRNTATLGLQLVNTLAEQLNGSIELEAAGGTTFKIRFAEIE